MDLHHVYSKMPKHVHHILNLLSHIKSIITVGFYHLGLTGPPDQIYDHEDLTDYILPDDRPENHPSPALVQVPITVSPSMLEPIKKRLPVVEFGDFLDRSGITKDMEIVCSVCLDCLGRNHEIRELSNCSHVFHRECLDAWVDQCQVTCPLCRSKLLPIQGDVRDPWIVERMSYLFGDDW